MVIANSRFKKKKEDGTEEGTGAPPQTFQIGNTVVSKEQFESARSAALTPEAREKSKSLDTQTKEALTKSEDIAILNKMTQKNIIEKRKQRILEAEGRRLGIIPDQSLIQAPTDTIMESQSRRATAQANIIDESKDAPFGLGDNKVARALATPKEAIAGTAKGLFRAETAITAIDAITGGGTFREPITLKKARSTFANLQTELSAGISDLSTGTGDAAAVTRQLQEAQNALERLEQFHHDKALNSLYLSYWADEGATVEAEIITMRSAVERMLQDAKAAEIAGNLAKTQALFGVEEQTR